MWKEKDTKYNYRIIENEGGKTLTYDPSSGVRILEVDGLAFKDLGRTGTLLPYEDWRLSPEERAEDLAGRLSVEEIAGLMCFSAHQTLLDRELNDEQKTFLDMHLRSILNSGGMVRVPDEKQVAWTNSLQAYVESKQWGIPCYISSDPRNGHGVADWPGNLGLAASFDPELAKEAAKCMSKELRDIGVTCFLAPQVDIAADPRWWRDSGTFGEDPALSRDLVKAFIDGLQSTYGPDGEDLGWGKDSVTAMVKHWTGEGASEGGREAHTDGGKYAVYPNDNFEALMIPFVDGAFKLDGKTGMAKSVMSSYTAAWSDDGSLGEVVGSGFSDYKINQLLRGRFGFNGAVCTDWMVLNEGPRKCGWGAKIESPDATPGERAFYAIMAGADQMGGCSNPQVLIDAYYYGCEKVGKEVMDKAFAVSARRLLSSYFLIGLFEDPYLDEDAVLADVNSPEKQAAALQAQIKGVVMLKNENGAIQKRDKRLKVYIPAIYNGPFWNMPFMSDPTDREAYVHYPLDPEIAKAFFDVVTDKVEGTQITRASEEELAGCDLFIIGAKEPENSSPQDGRDREGKFMPLTRQYGPYVADGPYVRKVSIAGDTLPDGTKENRSYYGQAASCINSDQLPQILEASEKAKKLGIPSVVVMITGKPMCFYEFEPSVDAILVTFAQALEPGAGGAAAAICRIIAGQAEPSGLLPMQMPKDMEDVERQLEDTPRDMECYTDSVGHKYDFAYGMNYAGVICDERVAKYSAAPLTKVGE